MLGVTTLFTAFIALTAAAPAAPSLEDRGLLSGQLTWYTEGMGVSATACGTIHQITEVSRMELFHNHYTLLPTVSVVPLVLLSWASRPRRLSLSLYSLSHNFYFFNTKPRLTLITAHCRRLSRRLRHIRQPQRQPCLRKADSHSRRQRQQRGCHGRRPLRWLHRAQH